MRTRHRRRCWRGILSCSLGFLDPQGSRLDAPAQGQPMLEKGRSATNPQSEWRSRGGRSCTLSLSPATGTQSVSCSRLGRAVHVLEVGAHVGTPLRRPPRRCPTPPLWDSAGRRLRPMGDGRCRLVRDGCRGLHGHVSAAKSTPGSRVAFEPSPTRSEIRQSESANRVSPPPFASRLGAATACRCSGWPQRCGSVALGRRWSEGPNGGRRGARAAPVGRRCSAPRPGG